MPAPIVIIGSINMDLVVRTPRIPVPGETILGGEFVTIPGGKGANQVVAAAKLASRGTGVHMIGRVGDDAFGERMLHGLSSNKVKTEFVKSTKGVSSGVAMIQVDAKGENSITVAPGANAKVTPKDVDAARDLIASAACVVLQLEIPFATVRHAINLCRKLGVFTILDPAPAPAEGLAAALYKVDLFTPNETEAQILLGQKGTKKPSDPKQVADAILKRGAKSAVLKLGGKGSLYAGGQGEHVFGQPFKVKVVDTTAAGDAFTAGLAVAHAEGMEMSQSLRFANAAGAICCESFGAQPALPTRAAVEKMLKRDK